MREEERGEEGEGDEGGREGKGGGEGGRREGEGGSTTAPTARMEEEEKWSVIDLKLRRESRREPTREGGRQGGQESVVPIFQIRFDYLNVWCI